MPYVKYSPPLATVRHLHTCIQKTKNRKIFNFDLLFVHKAEIGQSVVEKYDTIN